MDLIREKEDSHGHVRPVLVGRQLIPRGRVVYFENHNIHDLSRLMGFDYLKEVQKIANKRNGKIVHWGCRNGLAIKQLANLFPKLSFLGVSDIVYNSLKKRKRGNLKFVLDNKERGLRKIPKELDLVITDYDLIMADSVLLSHVKRNQIVESILSKLKVDGKLVMFTESGFQYNHGDTCTIAVDEYDKSKDMKFSIKMTKNKNSLVFTRLN